MATTWGSRSSGGAETVRGEPARGGRITEEQLAPLVLRYQRGDATALGELHERLAPVIYRTVGDLLRAYRPFRAQRDDLAQQSWVFLADLARRWQPVGSFLSYFCRSFPANLRRWLGTPDPRRMSPRVVSLPWEEMTALLEQPARERASLEDAFTTEDPLRGLSPRQRAVVALRIAEGASFREIGRACGTSAAQAHRDFLAAVAELRRRGARVDRGDRRDGDR